MTGCLIISLTHSLLVEIRAILIIQEAKYKLVYLTLLFIASLTCKYIAQYKLHNTKIYEQKNYTMQNYIKACDHITYVHNKYFNWFALNKTQHFNTRARVLKRTRDVILSSNIIFNSLQGSIVYCALA